ncbi:MAG: hypothetical protein GY861_01625 [bacterium]|nr:hypothetical protein [bacterium]
MKLFIIADTDYVVADTENEAVEWWCNFTGNKIEDFEDTVDEHSIKTKIRVACLNEWEEVTVEQYVTDNKIEYPFLVASSEC